MQKDLLSSLPVITALFAIKYEDRINDLAKRYKPQGYELIAINPNDPEVQPADSLKQCKYVQRKNHLPSHICLMKVSKYFHNMARQNSTYIPVG